MSAAVCVVVTFLTLFGSTAVSAVLSSPTNVSLTSRNMNLVLSWNPPEGAAGVLVYTAEYKTQFSSYRTGCVNISTWYCDFTSSNISVHGTYTGRVRAALGDEKSAWVGSNKITPDTDTVIGSPEVTLFPNGPMIEVSIRDPTFSLSTFRNVYAFPTYNITYWKDGQLEQARSMSEVQQDRVILPHLEAMTRYCVQVQIYTRNPRPSESSKTKCENTTDKEKVPWTAAVATFVIMAGAVALVVVTVVYWKTISHFLCPKDTLPLHFKEYLLAPPTSPMYLTMADSLPPEEVFHQVSIVAPDGTAEGEGCPQEAAGASCSSQPDVTAKER